ncbi:RNA recognition motif domain-containing protein [Ditylenchus destructor]|uniref:RNA recognition motif domain-containing protein n=1 Tax=Ditylenchus destructor TaxID=166010 RepID=A0AAD4MYA6_9BILA|nr:RNA recognition motif domain-containing protein [Ditylenchus destructor]
MSPLRNILQRCARNASILGGTPLQIQCTFNPVHSDPSCISRQAYSSDVNESPKNAIDPVQKYFLKMMNAKKSRSIVPEDQEESKDQNTAPGFGQSDLMKSPRNVAEDQEASKSFTTDSAQSTPFRQDDAMKSQPSDSEDQKASMAPTINKTDSMKSRPNIAQDQKTAKAPTFNKNLNLRKYCITIRGFSKETTPESLREFYSQFGEIAVCKIIFPGERDQFGSVAFTSREAMDRALDSLPHFIDGKEIKKVRPGVFGRKQLTLQVIDLSPKTTVESLKAFYSKFGWLNDCRIKRTTTGIGQIGEVQFAHQKDLHLALDAQPHVIDGSEVFLQYATYDLDFWIGYVPDGITEDALLAFYSKYGQLRECRLHKGNIGIQNAFVSYSEIAEINRAMADRPHIIDGKPLKVMFLGRAHLTSVSLLVGSLPENVTEETLREEFSKYGKPVFWKIENDGRFNQTGPYGIVMYSSEQEALNVLNSGPHTIEGSVVDVRKAVKPAKSWLKEKFYD